MIKSEKIYPLMAFAASFLLGCIFLSLSWNYQQVHDAGVYISYAQNIASEGIWKCGMHKEPGYSILIAPLFFLFSSPKAIMLARVLNIILISGTSLIFYLTLKILITDAPAKRIFFLSLLFAISPQLASFSALRVYGEPLQVFLNSVIIFCLIKIFANRAVPRHHHGELKYWIAAALATGWLMITKSFFLIYPFWISFFIIINQAFFCKTHNSFKALIKPLTVFLCLSLLIPFLWSARNYKKYGYFMVAGRGSEVLLCHTYLVEWGLKDAFKWGVFQISDNLGRFAFPNDTIKMARVTGEPYIKAQSFLNALPKDSSSKADLSASKEWWRLVKEHPFKYVLFYLLNSFNHILIEGIYPDIYPVNKTIFINFIYLSFAVSIHFLYSIFIWIIIIFGVLKYRANSKICLLKKIEPKYTIIPYCLLYFAFLAYHFHTEMRYFHPFFFHVYLLFALSCNYLINSRHIRPKES